MPNYTTSYNGGRRPRRRKPGMYLPGARRHQRSRKPGARYLKHSQGFSNHGRRAPRRRDARRSYALIAVGCALLIFMASVLWYMNRGVDVELNGSTVSVRIHSSVQQLIDDQSLDLTPGRLLAVDDSVLDKRGGEACSVKLDGKKVDAAQLDQVKLEGGEKLEVGNGEDTYEAHQVEATEIQPSITIDGTGPIQYVQTWGVAGRTEVWRGEVSGKTQDRGTVKQVVDCVVAAKSVRPDARTKKYVALTFDESPSSGTEQILSILKERGVKATFFLQGDAVDGGKDAVAKIAKAGHEVGSNGYADTDLTALSAEDLHSQLGRGFQAIKAAGAGTTALLRPPSGLFDEGSWAAAMDEVGVMVTWTLDSGDWTLPGAQSVVDTVMGSVSSGDIILLTDSDETASQNAEALGALIDRLQGEGYELVTLSGLIATDKDLAGEIPSTTKVKMPKGAVLPQVRAASGESAGE